jgi:hypothetical protein
MSPEDQDAVVGRLVRDRREVREQKAALEVEAANLGAIFQQLGELLQRSPVSVVFENQAVEMQFQRRDVPSCHGPLIAPFY